MKEHQSQNYGEYVRKEKLKNLLTAHRRLAETGGIKEVILLSKFILKLSNKFKLHNFCGFDVVLSSKLEAPTPCSLYGLESAV